MQSLPNRLGKVREVLVGGPQDVTMNRLLHKPDIVAGKNVLDAFAGSGVATFHSS
jgi:predicted nicotinamide N-methyase